MMWGHLSLKGDGACILSNVNTLQDALRIETIHIRVQKLLISVTAGSIDSLEEGLLKYISKILTLFIVLSCLRQVNI